MDKASRYLDTTLRIYALHGQANFTKCFIEQGKGNTSGAIDASKVTDQMVGPTAAFWHDMLPPLQPGATAYTSFSGFTSTIPGNAGLIQSVYDL